MRKAGGAESWSMRTKPWFFSCEANPEPQETSQPQRYPLWSQGAIMLPSIQTCTGKLSSQKSWF